MSFGSNFGYYKGSSAFLKQYNFITEKRSDHLFKCTSAQEAKIEGALEKSLDLHIGM